jgi:hypothetical protein
MPVRSRPGAAAAALIALVAMLAAGCSGPATAQPGKSGPEVSSEPVASPPATPTPSQRPSGAPTVTPLSWPPRDLQQTRAFPSARTRVFHGEMTDLWAAVVTDRPDLARHAFFPLGAYTQLKAIYDPAADWHNRLFGEFRLDVAAAHAVLGRHPKTAKLVRVIVPAAEASWIDPGVCYNSIGYWHVPGARILYRQKGTLRSIGIASLISWRGRWYVVHFGGVIRTTAGGMVDQPTVGPGTPGPPGGC